MVSQLICTVLHVAWCYVFIFIFDLKIYGAGLAVAVTAFSMFLVVTYISHRVTRIEDALFWPTSESFDDWAEYIAISLPATLMLCAELWASELFVLIASSFGTEQLAAMVIVNNIGTLMVMFTIGAQEAICTMVGNSIGANNVPLARKIQRITFGVSFCLCVMIALLVLIFRG